MNQNRTIRRRRMNELTAVRTTLNKAGTIPTNGTTASSSVKSPPEGAQTIMSRFDVKASEKIELSRGTLWLCGAAVVILNLLFSYGGSMLAWARDDQTQKVNISDIQNDMKSMAATVERLDQKFEKLDGRLREQERFIDKTTGFQAGVAETQSDNKKE